SWTPPSRRRLDSCCPASRATCRRRPSRDGAPAAIRFRRPRARPPIHLRERWQGAPPRGSCPVRLPRAFAPLAARRPWPLRPPTRNPPAARLSRISTCPSRRAGLRPVLPIDVRAPSRVGGLLEAPREKKTARQSVPSRETPAVAAVRLLLRVPVGVGCGKRL